MKLYRYFRVGDKDDVDINVHERYTLYAVTTNKEEAKLFEKSRKKGLFLKKVSKLNKKTCIEYLNKHRDSMLSWNQLKTVKTDDEKIRHVVVSVLMTEFEYDAIAMNEDSFSPVFDLYTYTVDPYMFKQKFQDMLFVTGYTGTWMIHEIDNLRCDDLGHMTLDALDNIEIDQLVLYLNMIKDQLNPKGFADIIRFI